MAESKFLKWQDKTGDGIPDVCEDLVPPAQIDPCSVCKPNPGAIVPDWRTKEVTEPFINERECIYQIAIVTNLTSTGAENTSNETAAEEALQEIYELHASDAMGGLLAFYNKKDSDETRDTLIQGLYPDDYYLGPPYFVATTLQLLYSVPIAVLDSLPAADEEDEERSEITPDPEIARIVSYEVTELFDKIMTVRKGLHLYNRYFKVSQFLEGTNIFFEDMGKVFNLEDYGDPGFGSTRSANIMADILPQLESFLNTKNIKMPGIGWPGFQDSATKLTFYFDKDYKIVQLDVYTAGCGPDKPITYKKSVDTHLYPKSAFQQPTAMAYLTRLDEMVRDLTARSPVPWVAFLLKHTYPKLYVKDGSTIETDATAGSCIKNALMKEGKELGQDLLDEAFSLGDAIAYKFHRNLCYKDQQKVLDEGTNLGFFTLADPESTDFKSNLLAVAQERAFGEIDSTAAGLCLSIAQFEESETTSNLDNLWRQVVARMKLCGLVDMMMEAIQCLFKGMSLEEGLGMIIKAALKGMGVQDFGALFILLPSEKQAELNALVQQKLNSGDIFKETGALQASSDADTAAALRWNAADPNSPDLLPWHDQRYIERQNTRDRSEKAMRQRRTLVQTLDSPGSGITVAGQPLNQDVVMEAYILALLDVYSGFYLELIDILNQFPGAEIVKTLVAVFDCPIPPQGDSSGYDFIKSERDLPYCMNINDIVLPRLENPFAWYPKNIDFVGLFMEAAKIAIQEMVTRMLMQIFLKICQTVSDAACKGLEVFGDLIQAPFSQDTLKELVKETFCGPDSDDDAANQALVELVASLGPGAIALADQQQALQFASDLSSATTRREFALAFDGRPPAALLKIGMRLINTEYTDYKEGLSSEDDLAAFFKGIGAAMPLGARKQLQDYAAGLDEDEFVPANPNLCATPEQQEQFCEIRSALLGDRASDAQKAHLCASPELNTDLADILQVGPSQTIAGSLPPILSQPGCDDGLLPFEPAASIVTATSVLDNDLEMLKIDFLEDMLGNGPGKSNWGMLNLVLSDTQGTPLSTHQRKQRWDFGKQNYVDFYVPSLGLPGNPFAITNLQKGAYPIKVAEWLREEIDYGPLSDEGMNSNNDFEDKKIESTKTFAEKKFDGWGNVNLLSLPDFGYNIKIDVDFENEKIDWVALGRKKTPDATLEYRNNAASDSVDPEDGPWNYGVDFEIFIADLEKTITPAERTAKGADATPTIHNVAGDNMRIKIYDITRSVDIGAILNASFLQVDDAQALLDSVMSTLPLVENKELKYEFLSIDNTLDDIDISPYVNFLSTFLQHSDYSPPVVLLREIIEQNGGSITLPEAQTFYESVLEGLLDSFANAIADNDAAFDYGASLETLTSDDLNYVIDSGQISGVAGGTSYADAEIPDPDNPSSSRKLKNGDQILGISEYQWKVKQGEQGYESNRVFYLDPDKFGGSYKSPPLYIAPPHDKGWLGLVDVLFPEQGACKPTRTDLVDFGDIQAKINKTYQHIPEDERLKLDRDCAIEVPYNRILQRPAVAGLEGIITAAIRIYASMHFIKSMATFTTIKPDFKTNFSSIYASYIIEDMEESFKDAQSGFAEFFTLFKDEEFWYAFLEQAVQLYSRRVDGRQIRGDDSDANADILDPPANVLKALYTINSMQEEYEIPDRQALKDAKDNNDAGPLQSLRSYKGDKSLEAIQATEEEAKLVLKELVKEQLQIMGEKFIENLGIIDLSPSIHDVAYYLLENLSEGSSLTIDGKEIKEEISTNSDLATIGEENYTNGNELVTATGENYIGFYHVHDGVYIEGEFHVPEDHGVLIPVANQVIVPIGDVAPYGSVAATTKPFTIEKYIAVEGAKYAPSDAVALISLNDGSDNISTVYPGTLTEVTDANGKVVGLEGELGVRYGVEFSVNIGGVKTPVVEVEIDVLDLPINKFTSIDANSKILLCLINKLKDNDKFKLIYRYIFSLPKVVSTLAIYNDMGFLPSIGEISVPEQASTSLDFTPDLENLPGRYVSDPSDMELQDGQIGWVTPSRRSGALGFFSLGWKEWDQVLMRNSKSRIKKIFKTYYNSANGMEDILTQLKDNDRPSWTWARNLKSRLKPLPGADLLPWWKKRKLRSSPFDAKGNLCEKK